MKKMIIALALVLAAGFAFTSNNALAWGHGHGHGGGYMMAGNGGGMGYGQGGYMMNGNNAAAYNSPEYKKFLDDTRDLRTSLRGDYAEMRALMAGTNPDPKRVRALSESISKKEMELSDKAASSNLPFRPMGHGGSGFNCPGYGRNR